MDLLDDEVFAVVMAVVVIGSVFAAAQVLAPRNPEPFSAIGLLNQDCVIGDYPTEAYEGDNLSLCLFVDNHLGHAALFRVVYKIGTNTSIPTNESPSPEAPIAEWEFLLEDGGNTTKKVVVPLIADLGGEVSKRVALIFELWYLNPSTGGWEYTGRWVHLYLLVKKPVLPGG